jgi:hypothetical protein
MVARPGAATAATSQTACCSTQEGPSASPETMSVQDLKLLVEELLPAIRTLCDAHRRPQLLAELDELHHLRA